MFDKRKSFLLILLITISNLLFSCTKLEDTKRLPLALTNQLSSNQTIEQTKISKEKVREAISSIGLILIRDNNKENLRPRGSGVVIRANGIIATNYHVIQNTQTEELYPEIFFELNKNDSNIERYRLTTTIINKEQDLALLQVIKESKDEKNQISINLPAINIETNPVELLDDIVVIGYPEKGGKTVTVNTGIVEGKDLLEEWIKTDARLIRGNSGGAAVNGNGKLIGIPTKIVVDSQEIDKDGDGFPDITQSYGAVGFLRPAYLITAMLGQLDKNSFSDNPNTTNPPDNVQQVIPVNLVTVQGKIIKSGTDNEPIAGARVGLIAAETDEVTPKNLLCWGGSNADGWFELNKAVPPGKYCLKVKAFGFEPYTQTIEIKEEQEIIIVKLSRLGG